MAQTDIIRSIEPVDAQPTVNSITVADLADVLAKGAADFWAMPTHAIFLGVIYPVVGLVIGRAAFGYDLIPLLYPLASGFALVGPLAAIGLYELSRRREAGMDTSWTHAFDVLRSPSFKQIAALGVLMLGIFAVWIAAANTIYGATLADRARGSGDSFLHLVLTTQQGRDLLIAGNLAGFVFAVVSFAISVISFPLLLDRNVGVATAVATSLRAVAHNPVVMATWGLIVVAALVLGTLPVFMGLAVVVPILGHATWHLYRKLVAR